MRPAQRLRIPWYVHDDEDALGDGDALGDEDALAEETFGDEESFAEDRLAEEICEEIAFFPFSACPSFCRQAFHVHDVQDIAAIHTCYALVTLLSRSA